MPNNRKLAKGLNSFNISSLETSAHRGHLHWHFEEREDALSAEAAVLLLGQCLHCGAGSVLCRVTPGQLAAAQEPAGSTVCLVGCVWISREERCHEVKKNNSKQGTALATAES